MATILIILGVFDVVGLVLLAYAQGLKNGEER